MYFKIQYTFFRRKCWKHITFPVPIEKEVKRIYKNGEKITQTISYKLRCDDSARFMASLLSNFAIKLAEKINETKCKCGHNNTKMWSMWN